MGRKIEYEGPVTVFIQEGGNAAPGVLLKEDEEVADVGFFVQSRYAPNVNDSASDLGTQIAGLLTHEGNCFQETIVGNLRITVEVVDEG